MNERSLHAFAYLEFLAYPRSGLISSNESRLHFQRALFVWQRMALRQVLEHASERSLGVSELRLAASTLPFRGHVTTAVPGEAEIRRLLGTRSTFPAAAAPSMHAS